MLMHLKEAQDTTSKALSHKIRKRHLCAKITWESWGKKKSLLSQTLEKKRPGRLLESCTRNKMVQRVPMILRVFCLTNKTDVNYKSKITRLEASTIDS